MARKNHIESVLLEQYILGLTSEEENKQVELYLNKNASIAKEIEENKKIIKEFAKDFVFPITKKNRKEVLYAVGQEEEISSKKESTPKINWLNRLVDYFK